MRLTDAQELQLREFQEQQWLNAFDLVLGEVDVGEEGELNVAQFKDHPLVSVIVCVPIPLLKLICLALHSLTSDASC